MSLIYTDTPAEFQPVLSDGIYFTLSSNTYNALTTFKFRFVYDLYVEDTLVFQGKCSPNPYGLGIVDLQQILETYTDSLPVSYWDTTPIYTHQTFPFSRPANDEVINFYIKSGYEYADSELGAITGFTGYGNSIGLPAVRSEVYKTFRSTMGTNGNATLQDFNINPFILSGAPIGQYPTRTGLFLTNAPRILDLQQTDYYTLGFTNYYLWSGFTSTGLSEPYYVEYNFYDTDGVLITGVTYENLTTNGGGPRTSCSEVYQSLYLVDPYSATTDYNTLYVAAGPKNFPFWSQISATTSQYTVQLFGKFTGSTTPIQPSPTPTPTQFLTPTPTPTPSSTPAGYCSGCTEYTLFWSGESLAVATITNCTTQQSQNVALTAGLYYNLCSCTYPVVEYAVQITTGGPCPQPVTPTPTPTPTNSCVCNEYLVENQEPYSDFIQYIDCNGTPQTTGLSGFQNITICACAGTIESTYSTVTLLGPCPSPTPTPTVTKTPTRTPTPTPTPGCFLQWLINECTGGTCSGGICACENSVSRYVYTNCSVTDITDPDTELYDTSALINPFTGDFVVSGSIYNSTGANVTLVCTVGGPC